MPCRGFKAGGVGVHVSVDDQLAARVRRSWMYRMFGERNQTPPSSAACPSISFRPDDGPISDRAAQRHPQLTSAVREIEWYHTIDLGDGLVTPGAFDHRLVMQHFAIPERLDGMRVLDVATFDGYWAFEFERRGAAEVVALDIEKFADLDLPPKVRDRLPAHVLQRKTGEGFALAHRQLGSKVKREVLNVYDVSPQRLGMFDFIFCGDLLLHLSNPVRALQNLRSVTAATALFTEPFDSNLPAGTMAYRGGFDRAVWWVMSAECMQQLILDAGFDKVEETARFKIGHRWEKPRFWRISFRASVESR